jgi:two-component system sensor histidine kinase KdpD
MHWLRLQFRDLRPRRLLITTLLFGIATGASFLGEALGKPITSPLFYVLGVTVIGATQGLFLGLVSAALAGVIYNFAVTDPVSFRLADADDFVPLIAFNLCAVVSGLLAGRLKDSVAHAQQGARELASVLEVSRRCQGVLTLVDLERLIPTFEPLKNRFDVALLIRKDDKLLPTTSPTEKPFSEMLRKSAEDFAATGQKSGPLGAWLAYGLYSANGPLGVLLLRPTVSSSPSVAASSMDAFINMIAITLERCFLLERLANSQAVERSEAFKTALLSSMSHDMRTPLSAISASASGLLAYESDMSPVVRAELLRTIKEQCDRLNRYTTDLLSLGRLQGGLDPQSLSDIDLVDALGGAINGIRPILEARTVVKSLPQQPLLVRADPVLLEQVFHNVLENAVMYSGRESRIEVSVDMAAGEAAVRVSDEGIGIPASELERVFDRFYRVEQNTSRARGSGLGLAIAKAFIEAFGGRIHAQSPTAAGCGTCIAVVLPLSVSRA